jgi:hypothetical protein
VVSHYVVEPGALVGAGLANNLLEIKRHTAADVMIKAVVMDQCRRLRYLSRLTSADVITKAIVTV